MARRLANLGQSPGLIVLDAGRAPRDGGRQGILRRSGLDATSPRRRAHVLHDLDVVSDVLPGTAGTPTAALAADSGCAVDLADHDFSRSSGGNSSATAALLLPRGFSVSIAVSDFSAVLQDI